MRLLFALHQVLPLTWLLHAGVDGVIMDDEFLRVSNGSWHRSKRKSVSFETACAYIHEPDLPLGCQYNASISNQWHYDSRRMKERELLITFWRTTGGFMGKWRSAD